MNFTTDWFSARKYYFEKHLLPLKGKDYLNFLEIGSFEGRSAIWCLDNVLTGKDTFIVCIDTFKGSPEHEGLGVNNEELFDRFLENVKPYKNKVQVFPNASYIVLRSLPMRSFDFIYIDGSHKASDVLEDAMSSWRLLKRGGMMAFDDHFWQFYDNRDKNCNTADEDLLLDEPQIAIDSFLRVFRKQYELLDDGEQVWIKKI